MGLVAGRWQPPSGIQKGGSQVPYVIPVTIQTDDEGVMAYNDELQVIATGSTPEEAMANFRHCLSEHVKEFGSAVLEAFAKRRYELVEVP